METNLFNQAFERQVIENEPNETLWQLAQKKLGGDVDAPLTTDAVLELAFKSKISLMARGRGWKAIHDNYRWELSDCPVRAILMCFLMMGKVAE